MTELNDIFRQFKAGRMRPFYSACYPRLLLYATRILGPRLSFMAEDCVQAAVLNTYIRRRDIGDMQKWRAWLLTAVRNNALMQLRGDEQKRKYEEYGMLSMDETEDVSLAMIEQDVYTQLFNAVDSLPEKYREIFFLNFRDGLKLAEIAERLNVAEITVKKRKAKLIELLRERLGSNIDEAYIFILLSSVSMLQN